MSRRIIPGLLLFVFFSCISAPAEGDVLEKTLTVTMSQQQTGMGTVTSADGISCPAQCSGLYAQGALVTLSAVPEPSSFFAGWGGACTGTGGCTVTMDADTEVTARFEKKPVLSFSRQGAGAGWMSTDPGTLCVGTCSQAYDPGAVVTVTAHPLAGADFTGWTGACSGTGSCTIVMDEDKTVTAAFDQREIVLAAGATTSLILSDGRVWSWGGNSSGQVGDGTMVARKTPVRLPVLDGTTALDSGNHSSGLALKNDGTIWGWGTNVFGTLGNGTTAGGLTPAQTVQGLPPVIAITTSGHSAAVTSDGKVWGWGVNNYGQVGNGTADQGDGLEYPLSPVEVVGLTGVAAVASSTYHTLALKSDGTVWAWGANFFGALGDGTTTHRYAPVQVTGLSDVVAVAAGGYSSAALKADGTVATWGDNAWGQIGDGTTSNHLTPFQVPGLEGVVAIAAGTSHVVALKGDGKVYAWGSNYSGQGGQPSTVSSLTTPAEVSDLSAVVSIGAGSGHSLAAKGDGTVWTWGHNAYGQLGDGSTINRNSPVQVLLDMTTPSTSAFPAGGIYPTSQTVTLSAGEPATIYYTLDGSTPTISSRVYSAPLAISSSTVVKFFAKDSAGNLEAVKTENYYIGPFVAPVADFRASATAGGAPLGLSFSDLSSGLATSWLWNFGDGSTSTLQNPLHVYDNAGSYTVSLTVTGPAGTDSISKADYITVLAEAPLPLQPRYDTATDGDFIKVLAGALTESLFLDRDISVTIGGGYETLYQRVVGATVIRGKLTVRNGKVSVANVTVQ